LPPEAYAGVSAGLPTALSDLTRTLISPELYDTVVQTAKSAFMDGMTRSFFVGALVMYGAALFAFLVLPDLVKSSRYSAEGEIPARDDTPLPATSVEGQD
jgi:hypothetical protein